MDILERLKIIAETTSADWPIASIDWEYREAVKEIEKLRFSLAFYQRRCEALPACQSKMRDPERTVVCDILANGFTLPPENAGDRYKLTPNAKVSGGGAFPPSA